MKANYSERLEIDVLEEPQLDFKYYINQTLKKNEEKPKKNKTLKKCPTLFYYYSDA